MECARELAVQPFVTADQLVGEAESWHESTTLFEPEDGAKRTGEEDALYYCKCDEVFSEGGVLGVAPRYDTAQSALRLMVGEVVAEACTVVGLPAKVTVTNGKFRFPCPSCHLV